MLSRYRAGAARQLEQFADAFWVPADKSRVMRRDAQIAYVHEHHTWRTLALEWQGWLSDIVRRQAA